MTPRRGIVLLATAALVFGACRPEKERARQLSDVLNDLPASPADQPASALPAASVAASEGALVIKVVDHNSRNPKGIPISVTGPEGRVDFFTDAKGLVRVPGPPGHYTFRVVTGCTGDVFVHSGGSGKAGVITGRDTSGELQVRWQHRIGPSGGAYPSMVPNWLIGKTVEVAYDVVDRCQEQKAPAQLYSSFRFQPSSNLELVDQPLMQADRNGLGHVNLRCSAPGAVSLRIYDGDNPTDEYDLIPYTGYNIRCTEG